MSSRLLEIVRDHGVVEPIVVRRAGEHYEILGNVEGWMAAQQVRLDRVPIHILEDVSDTDAAEIVSAAFESYSSNPIDETEYFRSQVLENARGRSHYKAVGRLASQTGHARPYISHALRLLKLPISIQEQIRKGQLNAGQARALVTLKDPTQQRALARRAAQEHLSVRRVEALARDLRGQAPHERQVAKKLASKPTDTLRLERIVSDLVGCRFEIQDDKAVFDFFGDLNVLEGLLERLGYRGE